MTSFRPIGEVAATIASAAARMEEGVYRGFGITHDPGRNPDAPWLYAEIDARGPNFGEATTAHAARRAVDALIDGDPA